MKAHMKTYNFEVILAAGTDMTEELADALFDAGCDDGTPGVRWGVPVITFHREADGLESAIRSAVSDVQKTGCVVERVQIEYDSLVDDLLKSSPEFQSLVAKSKAGPRKPFPPAR
ncbi:MAG: hypothetical protein WBL72_02405 [Thermoguttaceae bacterium]